MAAGEWVSVSSQSDVEQADLAREAEEIADNPEAEMEELAQIYQTRGLPRRLAEQVAVELSKGDALAAHARDELGLNEIHQARPGQAALASAGSFLIGGLVPLLGMLGPLSGTGRILLIVLVTIAGLAVAGALGAKAAGTTLARPMLRVVIGGTAAMAVTALVGQLVAVAGI